MANRCLGCMEIYGDEYDVCPHCGYVKGTHSAGNTYMVPGTLLDGRYIIGKVLGSGSFGVTYIAWDNKLEQKTAIKEYLPSESATRAADGLHVAALSGSKGNNFKTGLRDFLDEARKLAKFTSEEGIVRVFDSFECNDTAYIVMEYLEGQTLERYLEEKGIIPENDAVEMMMPVIDSLQVIHRAGIIHRDISPDNIFVTKDGSVKLIDFGEAITEAAAKKGDVTVTTRSGFSAEEQYRSDGEEGAYTDVYSIAATMYRMITGQAPADALERRSSLEKKKRDIITEPHRIIKNISESREVAILNALNITVKDRTPDMAAFKEELNAYPPAKRRYAGGGIINFYRWPLWVKILLPILIAVLIALGVFGLLIKPWESAGIEIDGFAKVPYVVGTFKDDAAGSIEAVRLYPVFSEPQEHKDYDNDIVVAQKPYEGFVKEFTIVYLSLCKNPTKEGEVPNLFYSTLEEAIELLKDAGIEDYEVVYAHSNLIAAGLIFDQSIKAGTPVESGMKMIITISDGPESSSVPDVVNSRLDAAKDTIVESGLSYIINYVHDDTLPEGTVIDQDLAAGSEAVYGDAVTITVTTKEDTSEVPDVTGMGASDAEAALKDQGFQVVVVEQYDDNVPEGSVIIQTTDGGVSAITGSVITIVVSKGQSPKTDNNPDIIVDTNLNLQEALLPKGDTPGLGDGGSDGSDSASEEETSTEEETAAEAETTTEAETSTEAETVPVEETTTEAETPVKEEAAESPDGSVPGEMLLNPEPQAGVGTAGMTINPAPVYHSGVSENNVPVGAVNPVAKTEYRYKDDKGKWGAWTEDKSPVYEGKEYEKRVTYSYYYYE